ncbi:unnamed protein product [Prunus armeniaca]
MNQGNTIIIVARMWTDIASPRPHLFQKVMHDICNYDTYFVQKAKTYSCFADACLWGICREVDEIARLGKSTILECLVRFCDAIENLYKREYLRKPMARDLRRLVQKDEARGFSRMIGSIDCMHWQWKNCPTAWQGDYGN